VRCEVRRADPRLRALVALLDADGAPVAETWRLVAAAAEASGQLRPSYALVRRLALRHRHLGRRKAELRRVALDAAETLLAGRVPNVHYTARRLGEANRRVVIAKEACVSETREPSSPRGRRRRGPPELEGYAASGSESYEPS
jgi:hypothetical protein